MPDVLSTADTTVGSGSFNSPIIIQAPVDTSDGMGGKTRTWTYYIKTMAHIKTWKGIEKIIGQQTYVSNISQFLIRYRPSQNIDGSMRILYRSRIYNIRNVIVPAEAQRIIQILAEEQQAQGSL
jgi:SPP1 family predicted phage head-tail adaptor